MDYRVKDLPKNERPREKLKENGIKHLTDTEILSLIIRAGIPGKNVKELSAEILNTYSVAELSETPIEELEKIEGISEVKAGQLKAASELAKRIHREERQKIKSFNDLKSVLADMRFESKEKIRLILLKSSNEVIDIIEIEGNVESVKFETRDILNQVIKRNAAGYIISHNHPSGKTEPTTEDLETTEKLLEASKTLGVKLLDHVIVGREFFSMKASTEIEFN